MDKKSRLAQIVSRLLALGFEVWMYHSQDFTKKESRNLIENLCWNEFPNKNKFKENKRRTGWV